MLLHFKFKNYKSFKEMQDFSFIAGPTKLYSERLENFKTYKVLKFSSLYGSNGSGKSNVIDALRTMKYLLLKGYNYGGLPFSYKLDNESSKKETYFEVVFTYKDETIYSYGFEYNSNTKEFISEWLTELTNNKAKDIFTRDIVNEDFFINFDHPMFEKIDNKLKTKLKVYKDDLTKDRNKLFIKDLNLKFENGIVEAFPIFKYVYTYFYDNISVISFNGSLLTSEYFITDNQIKKLEKCLKDFNTGIEYVTKKEMDIDIIKTILNKDLLDKIEKDAHQFLAHYTPLNKFIRVLVRDGAYFFELKFNVDGTMSGDKITFYHDKDKKVPFNFGEESDGTIRLIDLADVLITQKEDQLYIIDEFDDKLHPHITCRFITDYLNKSINSRNQLLIATHESRLLSFDVLRRDEIWFTEKDRNGESRLYSLEEFPVRFDKKIDKDYLEGRFGAIPVFDDVIPDFSDIKSEKTTLFRGENKL